VPSGQRRGRWSGVPLQERTARRRDELIAAGVTLLGKADGPALTVRAVCRAAELTERYFYESFTDLDALSAAVVDDIAEGVRRAAVAAADAAAHEPLEVQALSSVTAAVRALVDDPRRARVLLGGVAASPELHAHRTTVMHRLTDVLIDHGRTVHGVELEADPLAKVAPAFIVGGTADAILEFVNGGVDLSLDAFIAQLATLWLITGNGAAQVARARITPS